MVIVDTSVWIDYFAGTNNHQTDWLLRALSEQEIGLTDLVLCEVLQGLREESAFARTHGFLSLFALFPSSGEAVALASARNDRLLRSRGITIRNTIDCLIATFCLLEGHTLLHRDRDFAPFETLLGLRVVHSRHP